MEYATATNNSNLSALAGLRDVLQESPFAAIFVMDIGKKLRWHSSALSLGAMVLALRCSPSDEVNIANWVTELQAGKKAIFVAAALTQRALIGWPKMQATLDPAFRRGHCVTLRLSVRSFTGR